MTENQRLEICNSIVQEIASRGRKFFHHNGNTGGFEFTKSGRLVWRDEYRGNTVNVYDKLKGYCPQPVEFTNGGTLWALVLDMRDYILEGGDTNHNHGYGGLYCQNWGYPVEEMQAIQQKAIELGYLTSN